MIRWQTRPYSRHCKRVASTIRSAWLVPVKSALDSANCSVFSDPLVLHVRNNITREGHFE